MRDGSYYVCPQCGSTDVIIQNYQFQCANCEYASQDENDFVPCDHGNATNASVSMCNHGLGKVKEE